ncbi:MAG TPA: M48 family metallopeptidase [Pirellulales bacterium]|nr:M48 family metallopeptidase [Pirellulales bacterium]
MSKSALCRRCSHEYEVAPGTAYEAIECPKCRLRPAQLGAKLVAAFSGDIQPPETSKLYRLGIVLVALAMTLLPIIYVGLVVAVIYLVCMHATHWGPYLLADNQRTGGRRQATLFLVGYLGPLIAGAILIIFMLKPLLAARPKSPASRRLERADDPVLFDFVGRLCDVVGAPAPSEIRLDGLVNASASFRAGWMGMISNQLVLTIGAPLVAGLTLRQLTGVLAHEFGHFAQGSGMRLTYVIRSVNAWFARVVYERDAWDERLVSWGNRMPIRELQAVFWMTQLCIWSTRRILWALMCAGHAVSCFMLREMEFDADRCEARVAGSDMFAATLERVQVLNVAWQGALADTQRLLADGQLADNICDVLLDNVRRLPPSAADELRKTAADRKTHWSDTHPCDTDRIASARAEKAEGAFRLDGPATVLFESFPSLAREVSASFYQESLGEAFHSTRMLPAAEALTRQNAERDEASARERFFANTFNLLRPFAVAAASAPAPSNLQAAALELEEARATADRTVAGYREGFQRYDDADTRWMLAEQAASLIAGGLKVKPAEFQIERSDAKAAASGRDGAINEMNEVAEQLQPFEQATRRRMALAIGMLRVPGIARRLPNLSVSERELHQVLAATRALHRAWPEILQLRNGAGCLSILINNLAANQSNKKLRTALADKVEGVAKQVTALYERFSETAYPFDHAVQEATVAQYALEKLPAAEDIAAVYSSGATLINQLNLLAVRIAGRLSFLASAAEEALSTVQPAAEASSMPDAS